MAEKNRIFSEEQSKAERRKIRAEYRFFLETLKERKEILVRPENNELYDRLEEADRLFDKAGSSRSLSYDAIAVSHISTYGRLKATNLNTQLVRFQSVEFAEKVKTYLGENNDRTEPSRISASGWRKLGEATQQFYKKSPPFKFMSGSFEREPKPTQGKQARKLKEKGDNVVGKETMLIQQKTFAKNDSDESTTEEVERIFDILKKIYLEEGENPLCFFEFVLNPCSFGRTVENIFHLSFLIKDGLAELFLDDDGLPVIRPINRPPTTELERKNDQPLQQAVISITYEEWQKLVRTFHVEEAVITSRNSIQRCA